MNSVNSIEAGGKLRGIREGTEIKTQLENGRAVIELSLNILTEKTAGSGCFLVYLWDAGDELVFYCEHPAREEDPCVISLLHPHLWECGKNPYLYRLEIYEREEEWESLLGCMALPVRQLTSLSENGYLFNGRHFEPKAVLYDGICGQSAVGRGAFWEQAEGRLNRLVQMGADTVVLESLGPASWEETFRLRELCDKKGLLLWTKGEECAQNFRGGIAGRTLFTDGNLPTSHFYLQRAKWSREPFVYIDAGSVGRQSDGCFRVTVYSNVKRVALLVNGKVFAFQEDGPEFVFQDIPVRSRPFGLTAEAGDCSMSVVCY